MVRPLTPYVNVSIVLDYEKELDLISLRYYICKKETKELQSKGFFAKFADYLLEKKVPVEIDEILSNFDGWSEMYLKYSMLYFPEIVQWSKNTYFNLLYRPKDSKIAQSNFIRPLKTFW